MTVIINDFEIMVEPPGSGQQAGTQTNTPARPNETASRPPVLQPQDIERIVCHFERRRQRLAAD